MALELAIHIVTLCWINVSVKVKNDHRSKFSAMIILHFDLQPQFKYMNYSCILHIINVSVSTFMHQGQDIVVEVVFQWRQHGRMVRALDLKSGGRFLTTSWWYSRRSWVRFLSC